MWFLTCPQWLPFIGYWYFIIVAEITLSHLSPTFCALNSEFQLSMLDISLLFPQIFLTVGINLLTYWHYIFAAFYCGFCKELLVLLSRASPSGDMPWDRFELMLIQRTWAINTIEYLKKKKKKESGLSVLRTMVFVAFSLGGHNVGLLFTNVGVNGEGFWSGEQNESLEFISTCCSVSDASCVCAVEKCQRWIMLS